MVMETVKFSNKSEVGGFQCGSCEHLFNGGESVEECPHYGSGNFDEGMIDDESSIAVIADQEICVNCGERTRSIPRFDYTIEENTQNGWNFPDGGFICEGCEELSYAEAHLDGDRYCPKHGFIGSFFNEKDEDGDFIGCFEGCREAEEYDRQVRERFTEDSICRN